MTEHPPLTDDRKGAVLSDDRQYRYRLRRTWDVEKPVCAFILLNPSTADEIEDDQTLRRCIGYARDWGYGTVVLGNLFAYRTKHPSELADQADPVGPGNDAHLLEIADDADRVVAGWGNDGGLVGRAREVCRLLDGHGLQALVVNQTGHPKHPLYCGAGAEPEVFRYG